MRARYSTLATACIFGWLVAGALAGDNAVKFSRTIGGSGGDQVTAMVVDPSGNLVVVGSTNSLDFPVTNTSVNRGAAFSVSPDSGRTWMPLGNPAGLVLTLAADSGGVLYAGSTAGVFRSADGGNTWTATAPIPKLACGNTIAFCGVTAIAPHPTRPGVLYVGYGSQTGPSIVESARILKTVDGGATWTDASSGIPKVPSIDYIVIDPFHPDTLYASSDINYRSFDAGVTWSTYDLPHEAAGGLGGTGTRLAFDPFVSGTIYQSSYDGVFVSADSGVTWTHSSLRAPVVGVAADSLARNVVYAIDVSQSVYRSEDGGTTFIRVYQDNSAGRLLATDPFHPGVVLITSARSDDGGKTWSRISIGRGPQYLLFDPKRAGVLYAAAPVSSDAFVAKLDPSGKTLFATYLGGIGIESASGVATDAAGNIFVLGSTTSLDFPAGRPIPAPGQTTGSSETFLAKFDPQGNLLFAKIVPVTPQIGSGGNPLAVGPDGRPVAIGFFAIGQTNSNCQVGKFDEDGSNVFLRDFGGSSYDNCVSVAVDARGNIAVAGFTDSRDFPVTNGSIPLPPHAGRNGFVTKLDPAGAILFSTYLGGSGVPGSNRAEAGGDSASSVAFDSDGNIVVAGTASSKDFPTTPGAYQRSIRANCPYPSSAHATGIIGTIIDYQMDDGFIAKFDPNGALVFSTYFGGDCFDRIYGISLDGWGNIWAVGVTNSNPFPMAFPFEAGPAYAQYKSFAARISSDGSSVFFSSYVGGGDNPVIAATPGGDAYIGGSARPNYSAFSLGLPAPPTVLPPYPGFVAKIGGPPASSMSVIRVANAYTMRNGAVAPGELAIIDVVGMADVDSIDLGLRPADPLPRQLGRAQVFFDDEPAAIVSVTQGRIICVTPLSLAGKSSTLVRVIAQSDRSPDYRVDVAASDPGLLSADGSGQGQAFAMNEDGSLNSPANPAPRGSTLTFFATGAPFAANCPYGGVAPAEVAADSRGFTPIPGTLCGLSTFRVKVSPQAPPSPDVPLFIGDYLSSQSLSYAVK